MLLKSKNTAAAAAAASLAASHHHDHSSSGDDIFKAEPHHSSGGAAGSHRKLHHAVPSHLSTLTTTTTVVPVSALPLKPVHVHHATPSSKVFNDYDWDVVDEYDPLWPNEYEKLVKDRRDKDGSVSGGGGNSGEKHHQHGHHHHRSSYADRKRRGSGANVYHNRFESDGTNTNKTLQFSSGFGGRPRTNDEDDDDDTSATSGSGNNAAPRSVGAAIAPPPSLQESTPIIPASAAAAAAAAAAAGKDANFGASSVAAKIMAKYGFRDGQGLGKQEQGMSMALQVEKTSKRGGRIIHERESATALGSGGTSSPGRSADGGSITPPPSESMLMPTNIAASASTPSAVIQQPALANTIAQQLMLPPSIIPSTAVVAASKTGPAPAEEPTITEIMKAPSKVVLLRNMVGPGDVDNDLEPEVKDECNTKYGDVVSVVINELQNVVAEEAVRIFVEFKRIESAIKGELRVV